MGALILDSLELPHHTEVALHLQIPILCLRVQGEEVGDGEGFLKKITCGNDTLRARKVNDLMVKYLS